LDTTKTNVVVKPQTIAVISVIKQTGCTPFTVQFSALNSVNANGFEWNFGNGSPGNTSATPNYTFINNSDTVQKFKVRLIARKLQANTCPDTAYFYVSINPAPQANFGTNTSAGCGPLPITLTNTSTGGVSSFWVLSSGGISDTLRPNAQGKHDTIIDNPNFANKTIKVDQTVTTQFGCIAVKSQNIQIYPNLTAKFEADSLGCQPHVVKFKNISDNFQGTYNWNFGNGSTSTDKNPIQIYENYGGKDTSYKVTLTSKSWLGNCIRTNSVNIKVFATPRANFRFLSDSSIQLPVNTVTIGNRTGFRSNWTYKWTFDDDTKDINGNESFEHTFLLGSEDFTDTIFNVKMIAISPNGCTDTLIKRMVIKPGQPIAEFEATPREGCRPLEVQFTSLSKYAKRFEWSYVDKEGAPPIVITDRNPVVFFESSGLKSVKLKIRGLGGQDSIEKIEYINVLETPRSSFYADPTPPKTVVAPEQPAYFTPFENRSDFQYTWYFGDGDSAITRTAQHKYQDAGSYDITLKVVAPSGCISSDTIKSGVIARGEQILIAPTAFTPNPNGSNGGVVGGDGDNDVFYPFVQGVQYWTLQIFNRWGQPLFQTSELNHGWDGYFRGKIMPADTYIYRIEAGFSNGEAQTFLGDVTLIR
jgi:gliding motility-associated-like protein